MWRKDEAVWPHEPEDVKEKFCDSQGWGEIIITEQHTQTLTQQTTSMKCSPARISPSQGCLTCETEQQRCSSLPGI